MPSAEQPVARLVARVARAVPGPTRRRLPRASRRALVAGACAASLGIPAGAHADVVRLTMFRSDDAPSTAAVSLAPVTGPPAAGRPVTGLPDALGAVARSPEGGRVAFAGTENAIERPVRRAGVFGVGGGAAMPLLGPDGAPLGVDASGSDGPQYDLRAPWITWAPNGASLALHAFDVPRSDPWFAPPAVRRCDAATGRCGPVRHEDAIDLPGGGTVRVAAGLTAPAGEGRTGDPDSGSVDATVRKHLRRRFTVRVRVTGRPGAASAWSRTGTLRRGAPAYDRAYPSGAGVLVRLATVQHDATEGAYPGLDAGAGPAVIVRADGSMKHVRAFPYAVVGTLPDGRWLLAGGPAEWDRPVAGEPLRTLDRDGRVRVLRSGTRPITPVWVAHTAGLPDSRATAATVLRAGLDAPTGQLVLAMEAAESRFSGALYDELVATVPLNGSTPPRAPFGVQPVDRWDHTTTHLVE
jgi:hypothetical protein